MLGILNKVFDPTKRTISKYEKKQMKLKLSLKISRNYLTRLYEIKRSNLKKNLKKDNPWMTCWLKHLQRFARHHAA